jgi:3-oxoacyl-[acyl-carrier-protein] synthase-3
LLGPGKEPGEGVLSTHLFADGNYTDVLLQPAGGTREPMSPEVLASKRHLVKMNGREVYKMAVKHMTSAARQAMDTHGLRNEDVTWVVAHQANLRILEGISERVGIEMGRFYTNVDRYGNTSSASVPTALDEACERGIIKRGDILVLAALGGGLAWASAAIRW